MIVDLPQTTTSAISRSLVDLRDSGGAVALGRVLTLVIPTDEPDAEAAIQAANDASREHPCRVLVVARGNRRGTARLDGQIRVGGDAGASEVIVLRAYGPLVDHGDALIVPLLLPDAPVVAWWPGPPPASPSTDRIGAMAQRRITDAAAARRPAAALRTLAENHAPGDTDLAWTRLTLWRALLVAALDQPPFEPVTAATVTGASDSPSTELLAAWLAHTLRCPVTRARTKAGTGMASVRLQRRSGPVELVRPEGAVATLSQPGQPDRRISLPRRPVNDCLAEELRRLDPDDVYGEVLTRGLRRLEKARSTTASQAERTGEAPSVGETKARARSAAARAARTSRQMKRARPQEKERS
ncbi:MAG: glucose-6-phosphate dehydrogenase assembly protein OpcA [Actinomycetes bacterium]